MLETKGYHVKVEGTSYEAGRSWGEMILAKPGMKDLWTVSESPFSAEEEKRVLALFARYCPGVNEEIAGFAEVMRIPVGRVLYYVVSYLRPGCSQLAVLPSLTSNGHTIMARTYDFSDQMEEMLLCTTRITGRYGHIGSSIMTFGRSDGMNECGLAVSQTSAGFPVGHMEFSRKPAIAGLQFWAVIRSLLENCTDVAGAIELAMEMPIAYNINLLIADKGGNAALLESFDGEKAVKKINSLSDEQFICSTNHVHLPELRHYDPLSMRNSIIRYELMTRTARDKSNISSQDLKTLLSDKYPNGLCCHYYDEFFGTLRGMIFDLNEQTAEVCFGSTALNPWYTFKIEEEVKQGTYPVVLPKELASPEFFEVI